MAVAGIHFGNTNSVISVYMNGRVETVSNETGDRVTPSIVAFTGTEKVIGQPAKQYLTRNPLSCITNIKTSLQSNSKEINGYSCNVEYVNGSFIYHVKVDDRIIQVPTIEATSYILTKLLEIAELVGGDDLEDVVIAVPHGYSQDQLYDLREAAENIGFKVLRFISEPAAALLAYGVAQDDNKSDCRALVFRLGGSSMDATLFDVRGGMYKSLSRKSNRSFGGGDFDNEIEKIFIKEFKRKHKIDISENTKAVRKLKTAIEHCKHGLSQMHTCSCTVESLYDGIDFNSELQRARFESICGHLFAKCLNLVDELLREQQVNYDEIDKLILVGGGTRMPKLIKMFRDKFSSSEILNNINPEETISNGAALQASLLSDKNSSTLPQMDLFSLSKDIGIKLQKDGSDWKIIIVPKYTPVPFRKTCSFQKSQSKSRWVYIDIYEFDSKNDTEGRKLTSIGLNDIDNDHNGEFTLTLYMNRNGELNVTLSDKTSSKNENISIGISP